MKYKITEQGNKLILKVEIPPYRKKEKISRHHFGIERALEIIGENNYIGYIPENNKQTPLDNKFNVTKGDFVFVKKITLVNNNVDNQSESVLKSSKRRRRKSTNNTDQ
jgi:hypothetical protein